MERFQEVEEILNKLRPFLMRDGGDCELVAIEEGWVHIRMQGACGSCPSSTITLHAGIERALMEELEWVQGILEVK